MGMRMQMGIRMDWHPESRGHSRSRPSQLHLQTTGNHGYEFDNATSNNGSANFAANIEGEVDIPL